MERSGSKAMYFEFLKSCTAVYDLNDPAWTQGKSVALEDLDSMYEVMLRNTQKEHHPHTDLLLIRPTAVTR